MRVCLYHDLFMRAAESAAAVETGPLGLLHFHPHLKTKAGILERLLTLVRV